MRHDSLYLQDIIKACEMIQVFVENLTESSFLKSELHKAAILQKLTLIGEAAARLSTPFRQQHPEVEWVDINAFRNIAVHGYFSVQWDIVWATAMDDVPYLLAQIRQIISSIAQDPSD